MVNYDDNKWDLYHLYNKFRYNYKQITDINDMEEKGVLTPLKFHFVEFRIYNDICEYVKKLLEKNIENIKQDLLIKKYSIDEEAMVRVQINDIQENLKSLNVADIKFIEDFFSYADEVEYIINNEKRIEETINYIYDTYDENINSLLFFNRIDLGKKIYNKLFEKYGNKVKLIKGDVSTSVREQIKDEMENGKGYLIVASYGTTSTGINFKNVGKAYILEMKKSDIVIGQSLGRLQRTFEGKTHVDVYFLIDKINGYQNYLYRHYKSVLKTLKKEFGDERIKKDLRNNRIVIGDY
jgi:superfamily II DNA or RNA helicase